MDCVKCFYLSIITFFFYLATSITLENEAIGHPVADISDSNHLSNRIVISGRIDKAKAVDTLYIRVWDMVFDWTNSQYYPCIDTSVIIKNGMFDFSADINNVQYVYFSLYRGMNKKFNVRNVMFRSTFNFEGAFILKNGDSLFVDSKNDTTIFSGSGGSFVRAQQDIFANRERNLSAIKVATTPVKFLEKSFLRTFDMYQSAVQKSKLSYSSDSSLLEKSSLNHSSDRFKLLSELLTVRLRLDTLGSFERSYRLLLSMSNDSVYSNESIKLINYQLRLFRDLCLRSVLPTLNPVKTDSYIFISKELLDLCLLIEETRLQVETNYIKGRSPFKLANAVEARYSGRIKDLLLIVIANASQVTESSISIAKLIDKIEDPSIALLSKRLIRHTLVGSRAYDFQLMDFNQRLAKLSDYRGKVVVIDFWFTGCGACREYYSDVLTKVEKHYADNKDVVFLPVCVDGTYDQFRKSVLKGVYTSPDKTNVRNLTTAPDGGSHEMLKLYKIVGYPQPMVIDKQGNIFNYSFKDLRFEEPLIKTINSALQN